jgi:hypothetical protein
LLVRRTYLSQTTNELTLLENWKRRVDFGFQ